MADNKSPYNLNPTPEPNIGRLMVMFLLAGVVLYFAPYLFKTAAPPPAPANQKPETQAAAPVEKPAQQAAAAKTPAPAPQPAAAQQEQLYTVNTEVYEIRFSNRGATVRSWVLKKFKDSAGKPLELVAPGATKAGYPFAYAYPKKEKPAVDLNAALFVPQVTPEGIDYVFSDGTVYARKSFRFDKQGYLAQFSSEVTQGGKGVPHLISWRGGFGDSAVQNAAGQQRTVHYDRTAGKLIVENAKAAKDGPLTASGSFSFAGVEDNYFAAVFLPRDGGTIELRTVSNDVAGAAGGEPEPHVGAEVGGSAENQFALFVGPKDVDLLKKIDPRLEQIVDFGTYFGWLAKPLFLIINWLNDNFVHNFGWAIVVLTIVINFVLLPLRLKSMKSMKKMQALKPQIDVINAKYKNVGLRDPRKQQQNAEVMELYKKNGVNPMGGCLPMLLQMPLFIAFYSVLTVAIELRGASWLWVGDLSQPEPGAFKVLPILMVIAQYVQQKMTPNPSGDANQQRMMQILPLVFGFMFYNMSSGLVLYWLTSNLVGIVQQWFINKSMPSAVAAAPVAAAGGARPDKSNGGKKRSGKR